jgi:murein DD-endopeptidase MepM/ murein hydrolase activator NlpD
MVELGTTRAPAEAVRTTARVVSELTAPEGGTVVIHGEVRGPAALPREMVPAWRRLVRSRRVLASAAAVATLTAAVTTALLVTAHLQHRSDRARVAALEQDLAARQALLDSYDTRIAEIRREVAGWRDLHAEIWAPLGARGRPVGWGGAAGSLAEALRAPEPSGELELLSAVVREQGRSLQALRHFMARAGRLLAALPSRWPLVGPISSDFGARSSPWDGGREFHSGLDIRAEHGTPVHATAPGTVIFAGYRGEYGLTVVLDHGQGLRSLYGHLQRALTRPGDRVERGQIVGLAGSTGRTTGPHLHYEILVAGRPVNPRPFLLD